MICTLFGLVVFVAIPAVLAALLLPSLGDLDVVSSLRTGGATVVGLVFLLFLGLVLVVVTGTAQTMIGMPAAVIRAFGKLLSVLASPVNDLLKLAGL